MNPRREGRRIQTLDNLREEAMIEIQAIIQEKWRKDPVCKRTHITHRDVLSEVASIALVRTIEAASMEVFHRILKPRKESK